jgi:hypothetical protein
VVDGPVVDGPAVGRPPFLGVIERLADGTDGVVGKAQVILITPNSSVLPDCLFNPNQSALVRLVREDATKLTLPVSRRLGLEKGRLRALTARNKIAKLLNKAARERAKGRAIFTHHD